MNNEDTKRNRYPIFHDGNVLTSDDLNGSFNFLHRQLKDTRSLLFGQGIMNGLTCKYDSEKGEITISPGTALSASGSLIENTNEMTLRYYVDKADCLMQGLSEEALYILKAEATNGKELTDLENKDDYLLGLQVVGHEVYKDEKNRICSEQSCSICGDEVELELVPFLMKLGGGDNNSQDSTFNPIPKLKSLSTSGLADYSILPIFLRKATDSFYKKISVVRKRLNAIERIDFEHLLSESQWQWFKSLFGEEAVLQTSMDELDSIPFDNRRINTYLSFADDVYEAVNEFITFYNDFQSRYQLALDNRLEEAVILGRFVVAADAAADAKRYTWTETYRDYNRSKDERILVRLFARITLLIKCFSPEASPELDQDIQFTPSRVNAKLGEREVPHYYQSEGELTEYWDAHNDIHGEQQEASVSSLEAFDKADLYRLNFDNLSIFKLDDIRSQVKTNNLPIVVLNYELEGDDASYCLEGYKSEFEETEVALDGGAISESIFRKGLISDEDDKYHVAAALNDLWEYYPEYNVLKASDVLKDKKSNGELRESLIEEIRQSIYLLTKAEENENEQLTVDEKKALEFVLMAILYYKDKSVFDSVNMPGVGFVGGVEKRDALLLVTHRDKVLTCLNMPYLSLILNQDRFEDQLKKYGQEQKENDLEAIFKPQKVEEEEIEIVYKKLDLFMLRYGRNKQHTANYLREQKAILFKEAMEMVGNLPMFIFNTETREEASKICNDLNEELKANVLVIPTGMATMDANGKLESIPQRFSVKVTLFEEKKEEKAVENLQALLPQVKDAIEISKVSGEKAVWIRNITSEQMSVEDFTNLKYDAVFELYPISE